MAQNLEYGGGHLKPEAGNISSQRSDAQKRNPFR